jgi:hypothetical protein
LFASVVAPLIGIRAISAFCFTFFNSILKIRQNPDLEILRMGIVCLPVIAINYCLIELRREDTAIKVREMAHEHQSNVHLLQVMPKNIDYSQGEYRQVDYRQGDYR